MFKKTFVPFILILSLSVYGQKKELKAVDKLVESQDYDTALNQLLSLQSVVQDSELRYQVQYQFLAGKIYGGQKDFKASFAAFNSLVYEIQKQMVLVLNNMNIANQSSQNNGDANLDNSVTKKIGRNDPCPCGSGKKYKQCHGSAV